MNGKKIVEKINTTTLILSISCVILLIALIVAVAYWDYSNTNYTVLQSQTSAYVNDHSHTNEEFESLKSQLEQADNQLSTSNNQSTVSLLQDQVNSLQSQLADIEDFRNSTTLADKTWNQAAGSLASFSFQIAFSGAIHVIIDSSSPYEYVQVYWNCLSIAYNQNETVGSSGNFGFPILGSPSAPTTLSIWIRNSNPSDGASGTINVSYTY